MAPLSTPEHGRRRAPVRHPRLASALGLAAVCAVAAVDLAAVHPAAVDSAAGEPVASVTGTDRASSVAEALGITGEPVPTAEDRALLERVTASRAQRDSEQAAAAASQARTEKAAAQAKAEAAAEAEAAAQAEAEAAAQAEAEAAARAKAEAETAAAEAAGAAGTTHGADPAAAAPSATTAVARITNSAGPVTARAQAAADAVVTDVPGTAGLTIGGTRPGAADVGGHPSGRALDYMVGSNSALGDAIVEYHIANWDALGVDYIIWEQRMLSSPGGSWSHMADRGSPTANHMDHPHVNYR